MAERKVLTATEAATAYQPVDSDLTSLAALTTTSFGRGLLELANQGALLTAAGGAAASHTHAQADVTGLVASLAGGLSIRTFTTGHYYMAGFGHDVGAGVQTLNKVIFAPFFVGATKTFDRIGARVTSGIATGVYRFGIYNNTAGHYPGTLLADYGTVDCSGNGLKEITISQQLTTGVWWVACVPQVAAATVGRLEPQVFGTPNQNMASNTAAGAPFQDSVTGALPDPAVPGSTGKTLYTAVGLRAA